MEKDLLKDCAKCVFRDKKSGNVPTCLRGYIYHGNEGTFIIDCKMKNEEVEASLIKEDEEDEDE